MQSPASHLPMAMSTRSVAAALQLPAVQHDAYADLRLPGSDGIAIANSKKEGSSIYLNHVYAMLC